MTKYEVVRPWATASDGTRIPISIIYRKDLVKLDGSDPLLLSGYGSYEVFLYASLLTSTVATEYLYAACSSANCGSHVFVTGKILKDPLHHCRCLHIWLSSSSAHEMSNHIILNVFVVALVWNKSGRWLFNLLFGRTYLPSIWSLMLCGHNCAGTKRSLFCLL
jgi:hypothetical protein